MSTFLVTGAGGFIGGHVVARLAADGHDIRAVSRRPHAAPEGSTPVQHDLTAGPLPAEALDGVDCVIHLAGEMNAAEAPGGIDSSANVRMAETLGSALSDSAVNRVIVVSSIAASVAEGAALSQRAYGREKLRAEEVLKAHLAQDRMLVVLRPPAVYGPGGRRNVNALAALVRKGLPLPLGSAKTPRPYLSAANLADLIAFCTTVPASGPSPVVIEPHDGALVAANDLVAMLGDAMGKRAVCVPCPHALLRLLGRATGKTELISGVLDPVSLRPERDAQTVLGWTAPERMPASLEFLRSG